MDMRLNTLSPAPGSKTSKSVGRGIGSGLGKTGGRGHKGLKSRSGGSVKPGFEGGQMPLQRRAKVRFHQPQSQLAQEVRSHELALVEADVIDLEALKAAGLVHGQHCVKVMLSGELSRAVTVKGIKSPKVRAQIKWLAVRSRNNRWQHAATWQNRAV